MIPAKSVAVCLLLFATGSAQDRGRYQNAAALYDSGNWKDALAEIRLGLKDAPDIPTSGLLRTLESWCLLRLALENDGDLEDARRSFEQTLSLSGAESASPQVLLGYGMCRLELGKLRRSQALEQREKLRHSQPVGRELTRAREQLASLEDDVSTHLQVAAENFEVLMNNNSPFIEALVGMMETSVLQDEPAAAKRVGKAALENCAERSEMERTANRAWASGASRRLGISIEREILIREVMVGVHLALGAEDLAVDEVVQVLELDPAHALEMPAIIALRHSQKPGDAEIAALLRVVERDGRSADLTSEAITTLGVIGPAAKEAIPTLEKLTEHKDRQIAERAKAALRQIRGERNA